MQNAFNFSKRGARQSQEWFNGNFYLRELELLREQQHVAEYFLNLEGKSNKMGLLFYTHRLDILK